MQGTGVKTLKLTVMEVPEDFGDGGGVAENPGTYVSTYGRACKK